MYILYYILYFVKIRGIKKFSVTVTKVHVKNVSGNYYIVLYYIYYYIYYYINNNIYRAGNKTNTCPSLYTISRPHPTYHYNIFYYVYY